jgi:hypothetical protein
MPGFVCQSNRRAGELASAPRRREAGIWFNKACVLELLSIDERLACASDVSKTGG